jgi:hypothetical protein
MSDRWAEFGQVGRSRACTLDAHDDCAHFVTTGGGFNLRRLRFEFGAGLCPCTCHASCPVTTRGKRLTVPAAVWRESCTCPGAGQERRRLDEAGVEFPGFGEIREDARRRSRARKEAFESARARAAGKDRDEIREIYVAELTSRGLRAPREDHLDAAVDQITGNPLPAARLVVEDLAQMGRALRELSRIFRPGS